MPLWNSCWISSTGKEKLPDVSNGCSNASTLLRSSCSADCKHNTRIERKNAGIHWDCPCDCCGWLHLVTSKSLKGTATGSIYHCWWNGKDPEQNLNGIKLGLEGGFHCHRRRATEASAGKLRLLTMKETTVDPSKEEVKHTPTQRRYSRETPWSEENL